MVKGRIICGFGRQGLTRRGNSLRIGLVFEGAGLLVMILYSFRVKPFDLAVLQLSISINTLFESLLITVGRNVEMHKQVCTVCTYKFALFAHTITWLSEWGDSQQLQSSFFFSFLNKQHQYNTLCARPTFSAYPN